MAAATSIITTSSDSVKSAYCDLGSSMSASTTTTTKTNTTSHSHQPAAAPALPDFSLNEGPLQDFKNQNVAENLLVGATSSPDPILVYPPPGILDEKSLHYEHDSDLKPFPTPVSLVSSDRSSLFAPSRHRDTYKSSNPNGLHVVKPEGRKRGKSFTEVVAEKAIQNLAAPVSIPLVMLCLSWYASSAVSNTLNKSILTIFPYPITLSLVQFFLAVCFGLSTILLAQNSPAVFRALPVGTVSHSGIRYPTREILASTLPMGIFQLFGHIFSHKATSLIPVSLVHTIKALSPMFTVAVYRIVFRVKYPAKTYFSLIPLTTGVVMTCSTQFSSQMQGVLFALTAALIFVSQNIYSKKLLTHQPSSTSGIPESNTSGAVTPRIDKLNILCYCSSLAFIFTFPIWLFSEGLTLGDDYMNQSGRFFNSVVTAAGSSSPTSASGVVATGAAFSTSYLLISFLMNGLSHFLQNILAFQVLGMVSPVTYSVASLVKRIVVVTFSILWFGQRVNALQGWGILLTFFGLYLYDRLGGDTHKQRKYANVSLQTQSALPK